MKRKLLSKKMLVWFLAVMLIVASMTGCGGKDEDDEDKDTKSKQEQSVEDEDDEDEDSEKEEDSEAATSDEDEEVKEVEEVEEVEEDISAEEITETEEEEIVESETSDEAYGVVLKMVEACEGKTATKMSMDMEVGMSIGAEGMFIDMDIALSGDSFSSMNPYMSYSEMALNMSVMGENVVETIKTYVVEEEGNMVTYTYDAATDQWIKEDMGMDVETMNSQQGVANQWLLDKPATDFVLDSQMSNINGKDAYKLSFTLTGDELQNALNGMSSMEDVLTGSGLEDLDLSSLAIPAVYYVDAENYQPVGMEMTIEGMDELMADLMDDLMAAEGAEYSMTFELTKCSIAFTDISYDPVEIPELPEEALAAGSEL